MAALIILDASVLIALLDEADPYHARLDRLSLPDAIVLATARQLDGGS